MNGCKSLRLKKKYKWICLGIIISITYCFILIDVWCSYNCLKITEVTVSNDKIKSPITVVQLTDIHDNMFGKNNKRLIKKIKINNPDIIVITGDIINSEDCEINEMKSLISGLADIAPTYISLGNQEVESQNYTRNDIIQCFSECGAIVLDKEYIDIVVKEQKIRISGIYGYCLPERYNKNKDEVTFLRKFEETDRYKILLSHLPYAWTEYGFTKDYNIDLVFCGHVHGGQIVVPFIGGLYDQETGVFPQKTRGVYEKDDTVVILSSGLGSKKELLPRFNNIPEIVVAKIYPNNK